MRSAAGVLLAVLAPLAVATFGHKPYVLCDDYVGFDFLAGFEHQAIADPTHGRVNYVDQETAICNNLTYVDHDTLVIRADYKTVLDPDGPGRNSVRIRSRKTYTQHLVVLDVRHMPQGAATWPAAWEVREDGWPNYGEVDIIEGVNDISPNAATLHTTTNCTMPADNRLMTGTATQLDCDVAVNYNAGCGVRMAPTNSYGPAFNAVGGGYFVMERTSEFFKVWFWSRSDENVPPAVKTGSWGVDPSDFGTPSAFFPNTSCDIDHFFGEHNIIINLTLCGDWAGNVYPGGMDACIDFVNNNPSKFEDAYWEINAVRVYEQFKQ